MAERKKPDTLTAQRALSLLPKWEICPEWQRKHDAGELEPGLLGMCGMVDTVWPTERLTIEEARYILALHETHSMRAVAAEVFGDSNQIFGSEIITAARRVVEDADLAAIDEA